MMFTLLLAATCLAQTPIVYATWGTREMKADLYVPTQFNGPHPAIIYIHGGGWRGGTPKQFQTHARKMADLGFLGLSIEYRFQQEAKWPAALDDTLAALAWLRKNAQEYRIDLNRLGAAGGSAGGQLAALLGVHGRVKAVAAFNPALDLVALAGESLGKDSVTNYLGATYKEKPAIWKEASPIEHISAQSARFLFLHGDADTTVPYAHTVRMHELLKKAGVHSELFTAPGANHAFFNREPWLEPTLQRMAEFFQRELK